MNEFTDRLLPALDESWRRTCDALNRHRGPEGFWTGRLSSSALSTATAVMALSARLESEGGAADERRHWQFLCERGEGWLVRHQNDDGGWGDTELSHSNISTTALVWGAIPNQTRNAGVLASCEAWLRQAIGAAGDDVDPPSLARALRERYGNDHTFSVPILTALALRGRLGPLPDAWRMIPQLPFEFAAFPRAWYARLRMRVVSYALPALIAIGLVRFRRAAGGHVMRRALRRLVTGRVLSILADIQPSSGGYLEAIPLTSFVCLSLIGAGWATHPVVTAGVRFLESTAREDGSWPIDTNLATWVSTLAVNALQDPRAPGTLRGVDDAERTALRRWLLGQQYRKTHPYTQAAPGGWAWTDLPGGVPDADDTPGAMLALSLLNDGSADVLAAARAGAGWLVGTQNRDGGMPTFCRGWGQLPFDRSSADLTAHAIRAWTSWLPRLEGAEKARVGDAIRRGIDYLIRVQRSDGAWIPLWFGNQFLPAEENPTYGTSRVLVAWAAWRASGVSHPAFDLCAVRGFHWLLGAQQEKGGWGGGAQGPPSVEETGLAVDALCRCAQLVQGIDRDGSAQSGEKTFRRIAQGCQALIELTQGGTQFAPAPIGFYFAKLWYYESLYPIAFAAMGLRSALAWMARQ